MSVNSKRVFYVKYLANPIYIDIMKARPDRLEPVRGLAHDQQIGFFGEDQLEAAAEHRMVVDDQHTNRGVVTVGNVQGAQPSTSMRPNAPSRRR